MTDVRPILPPKIPIKGEHKNGYLKALGKKKTSQLSVFLPQGTYQLLNEHIAHIPTQMCTHTNQDSEIKQKVIL